MDCPWRPASSAPSRRKGGNTSSALPGESAFTLFLGVDESPGYFGKISRGHFIYTPRSDGLGELHRARLEELKRAFPRISKQELFHWLEGFLRKEFLRNLDTGPEGQIPGPARQDGTRDQRAFRRLRFSSWRNRPDGWTN